MIAAGELCFFLITLVGSQIYGNRKAPTRATLYIYTSALSDHSLEESKKALCLYFSM